MNQRAVIRFFNHYVNQNNEKYCIKCCIEYHFIDNQIIVLSKMHLSLIILLVALLPINGLLAYHDPDMEFGYLPPWCLGIHNHLKGVIVPNRECLRDPFVPKLIACLVPKTNKLRWFDPYVWGDDVRYVRRSATGSWWVKLGFATSTVPGEWFKIEDIYERKLIDIFIKDEEEQYKINKSAIIPYHKPHFHCTSLL